MLDTSILKQVSDVFAGLENDYTLDVRTDASRAEAAELKAFVNDFVSTSAHLSANFTDTNDALLSFSLLKGGQPVGITFRGIPNGHEFTSLLLAVLNADGKGKNLPDEAISRRIANLKGDIKLQTYVSLTCTNCPDVVQALNIMALTNSRVSSEMIDGALFQDEVARLNIQAVPAVYANGELLHIGRGDLGELLGKLEDMFGSEDDNNAEPVERQFDLVVIGGGPAGAAAAIYSARKGF
jgi:alkyl hydroperoxide reductase